MENKDDLISRRAVLDMLRNESVMHVPYEQYEAAARKHLTADISQQVKSLPGQMTAAEAWDIAGMVAYAKYSGEISDKELKEIFGTAYIDEIFDDYTPQEAKAKLEAWENRLKVGDIVEYVGAKGKAVITKLYSDNVRCEAMTIAGKTNEYPLSNLRKTGRTIDIQGILDQLGE